MEKNNANSEKFENNKKFARRLKSQISKKNVTLNV
jgi:hypothetical protein